jgi:hypothetical protein
MRNRILHTDEFLRLESAEVETGIEIYFKVDILPLYMGAYPSAISILASEIPKIFACTCRNPEGNSFKEEAIDTEIAHLFEHILIYYMAQAKGWAVGEANFVAETRWDWNQGELGEFSIFILMETADWKYLRQALPHALAVLNKIIMADLDTLGLATKTARN